MFDRAEFEASAFRKNNLPINGKAQPNLIG